MTDETLAGRFAWLVDTHCEGKVKHAAAEWGVARGALRAILSGKTVAPQLATLVAIREKTGASLEWLVYGVGDRPTIKRSPVPIAVQRAIRKHFPPEKIPAAIAALEALFGPPDGATLVPRPTRKR